MKCFNGQRFSSPANLLWYIQSVDRDKDRTICRRFLFDQLKREVRVKAIHLYKEVRWNLMYKFTMMSLTVYSTSFNI